MAFVKQRDLFHFAVKYEIWDPNMSSIGAITCQPDPFEGEEGVDAQINEAKFDISWIRSQSKNIDRFVSVVQRLFNESCSDTRKPPLQIRVFADGNTDRDKLFLHMLRSRLASAIPIWWNVPFQKRKLLNIHGALTAQFISAVEAESLALENNGGRAFWRDAMDEVFRHQDKSSVLPVRMYRSLLHKSSRRFARFYSFTYTVSMREPSFSKLGPLHTSMFEAHFDQPKTSSDVSISAGIAHGSIYAEIAVSSLREKRPSGSWTFDDATKTLKTVAAARQFDLDNIERFRITF